MSPRKKYWLSLVFMLLVIAGMWGGIALAGIEPVLGLDLQGGLSVVLTPKEKVKNDTLEKAVEIIRQRVDALGVAEPDISRQGENILIQLPGIKDPEKALGVIGTTAQMRFRPVLEEIPPGSPAYEQTPPPCEDSLDIEEKSEDLTKEVVRCARESNPDTKKDFPYEQWPKLRLAAAALVGTDIAGAEATPPSGDPSAGGAGWSVSLRLTSAGAKKFEAVTGKLACNQGVQRQLAIVLDAVIESHPQMSEEIQCNEGIAGGEATITGTFSEQEAKDLALVLRYGALPVALEPSTITTVSPTLGRDTLSTGLRAGIIGVGLVFVYVLLFYRVLGIITWIGMAFFGAFVLGVIIILGETVGFALTLAGIAGLIVSVGIAADSFIVYFERLKDEVHQGKTVRAAVDRAWVSARRTIVAADLVTALAALVLYVLAVGSVRGFALTLGLSTLLDLFISFWLMHPAVWLLSQTKFFNKSNVFGIRRVTGPDTTVPAPVAGGGK